MNPGRTLSPFPPLAPLLVSALLLLPVGCNSGSRRGGSSPTPTPDASGSDAAETPDASVEDGSTDRDVVPTPRGHLYTEGRYLHDSCGNRLIVRGVEQVIGLGIDVDGSWELLLDEIAGTGANAIRILPNLEQLGPSDVDQLLTAIGNRGMIAYVTPGIPEGTPDLAEQTIAWFLRGDVREVLLRHERYIVLDAYQEGEFDDRSQWEAEATDAVSRVRAAGYRAPLVALMNLFGRDLPSGLDGGARVVAADPMGNTIIGWQAYWGVDGNGYNYYSDIYGMTLSQAMERVRDAEFPIQVGLDAVTDPFVSPESRLDYQTLMRDAQSYDVGWLWWDWYNPFGRDNNLTQNGTGRALTSYGTAVIEGPTGIRATAARACIP
ncbi:MAG: hypothetical protein AAGF12_03735 [Myxococcota bacterium]